MRVLDFLYPALLASGAEALKVKIGTKIKLSNVQSLTLRNGMDTTHRRVEAIPQLNCIGGSARGLYEVDVMRCKNSGTDYDDDSIQWTCTASLPEEFKLGSTDVICEGYDSPDDPYILKGSCGVEYRLVLTEKGQAKYGRGRGGWRDEDGEEHGPKTMAEKIAAGVFWSLFIGVALWIVYNVFLGWTRRTQGGDAGVNRPGWGGGGGGGGGWRGGNEGYDDAPPPYDYQPGTNKPRDGYGTNQGWRPGFLSGAMGGAAAGWAAGQMGNRGNQTGSRWGGGDGGRSQWDNGEGNSRSSSGSSFSSTRHESTGFGSTSRR